MVWVPAPVFFCGVMALFLTKKEKTHSNDDISKWPHDTSTSIHKATKFKLLQNLNRLPAKPCPFDHSHIYVAERLPNSALDWIRCNNSNSLIWHILPFRSTFTPLILSLPTPPTLHCNGIAWSHGRIPHHSNCGIHNVKQNFTVSSRVEFYSPLYPTFLHP